MTKSRAIALGSVLGVLSGLGAAPARAEEPERHRIALSAQGGPAFPRCSPGCPEVGGGYAFGAGAMIRLSHAWAMGGRVERAWFRWTPTGFDSEHATTTLGALGARFYPLELGRFDPYLELDVGGTSWGATGAHSSSPPGGASIVPALGLDVLALSGFEVGARASYTFIVLNKTGTADLTYSEGPRIPPIAGIFQLSAVVTFELGPALPP